MIDLLSRPVSIFNCHGLQLVSNPACRVHTLCNQLLSHFQADILQTLLSCYGHIEDVDETL
jgi:DNA-binding IscR family transcriptional regulator